MCVYIYIYIYTHTYICARRADLAGAGLYLHFDNVCFKQTLTNNEYPTPIPGVFKGISEKQVVEMIVRPPYGSCNSWGRGADCTERVEVINQHK